MINFLLKKSPGKLVLTFMLLCCIQMQETRASAESHKTSPNLAAKEDRIVVKREDIVITGTVKDEKGESIPGVNVVLKGTTIGTLTDAMGNYTLKVNDPNGILVFTYIGFAKEEVSINSQAKVDVKMLPDIESLQEVVVIGYGTQKRKDLTGSISSVSSEDIKKVAATSLDQALQGRAAGVQVTQASSAPGGGVQIRIRGGNSINASNEPLYVIDGIPIFPNNNTYSAGTSENTQPSNALASINPADIESMEILKDASATAIYGSRGANGVIIITTKRGKEGRSNVDIESYYGVQQVARKLDLLNATQFAELRNEADINAGKAPTFTPDQIASLGKGTDWQDEIFVTAPIQNHQLTFSGGSDGTRYAVSGNYFDQKGVILNSGFKRGSFRVNIDKKISNRLNIGNTLLLSRSINDQIIEGVTRGGVVNAALVFTPTIPVYDINTGEYTFDNSGVPGQQQVGNPVADAKETIYRSASNRVLGNFFADFKIIEGLIFKAQTGLDYSATRRDFYTPNFVNRGRNAGGIAAAEKRDIITPIFTSTLTYNKAFGVNDITLLAGFETQSQSGDSLVGNSRGYATNLLESNNLASGSQPGVQNSGRGKWRLDSWFGRANYSLLNKYIFTATLRADGSSRFSEGNKWGLFPSGAIKWRVSNENFMKSFTFLSDLSIRTSYGLTGNQEILPYSSLSQQRLANYPFGSSTQIGYVPFRLSNDDLRWEKTSTFDIGLDVGILANRVNFTADYYFKNTRDLLLDYSLPRTTGFETFTQNLGSQQNQGLELSLNSNNLVGAFTWTTSANIAFNRNKITSLAPGETFRLVGNGDGHLQIPSPYILKVGEPLGAFYGRKTNGIWQVGDEDLIASTDPSAKPGDIRYVDLKPDGKIDNNDRTILGSAQPDFIYGFSNNFGYKNFDLSIFFQGVYGNSVWNVNRHELENVNGSSNNSIRALERWRAPNAATGDVGNPSNTMPSAKTRPFILSDRQIEDGSFLRLRNINLGYNLPVSKLNIGWLQKLRVYVSGQNLLTFTKYTGFDPEVNANGQSNLSLGTDRGSFPLAKMYTFGINVGL